jgi:high-affinity Fe2+/Pb2+ permease
MKVDYRNWIPKNLMVGLLSGTIIAIALTFVFVNIGFNNIACNNIIAIFVIVLAICSAWSIYAFHIFSYNGKRQLSKEIINEIAQYVLLKKFLVIVV